MVGFEKVKLERNVDNSGREFWRECFFLGGGAEILEKHGRKISTENFHHQNSLRYSPTIFLKFAGPKLSTPNLYPEDSFHTDSGN